MCPKKAKKKRTIIELLDQVSMLWILYRLGILEKWLKEPAKDAEKSSDKNTINTASTVGNSAKGKRSLKEKSGKQ